MQVLRLPRSKVQLGAPLPWNVRDANGVLLLSKGYVVREAQQLDELLERGAFVDIEEVRAAAQAQAPEPPKVLALPNLFTLWDQQAKNLRDLCQPQFRHDFIAQLQIYAGQLVRLLDLQIDIGLYHAVRQENQPLFYYGYNHAIHTAVLCVLLARHIKWPAPDIHSLLMAALTMNLSILELQGEMAAQEVPMRDAQKKEIMAHPEQAVALLQVMGVAETRWLTAVAQHHEHVDGSGYPSGCQNPTEMAIALRVCDVFMAKISSRAVREALTPQEAVRQLYREDHGGPMSTAVVKQFGIFPPGDFVRLASGELGIVVQRTANSRAPIVAVVTDTQGRPSTKTIRRDSGQAAFAITGNVVDKAFLKRLPPQRLFGFATVQV